MTNLRAALEDLVTVTDQMATTTNNGMCDDALKVALAALAAAPPEEVKEITPGASRTFVRKLVDDPNSASGQSLRDVEVAPVAPDTKSDGGVESRHPARAEGLAALPVSDEAGNPEGGLAASSGSRSAAGVAPGPSDPTPPADVRKADYYAIQAALSPHMSSMTELMSAMSSIWPLISSSLITPDTTAVAPQADAERMRRALERIAAWGNTEAGYGKAAAIARAALTPPDGARETTEYHLTSTRFAEVACDDKSNCRWPECDCHKVRARETAKSSDGSPVNPDQEVARQHEYPDESRSGRKSSRNQSAPSETITTPAQDRREEMLPPETIAWRFIDHHRAPAYLHDALTDLVRRARNDTALPQPKGEPSQVTYNLGRWLSAALDDPQVCVEMKADINSWMEAGRPNVQPGEPSQEWDDHFDHLEGGLRLLLAAVEADDPLNEIAFRIEDELQQIDRLRALRREPGGRCLTERVRELEKHLNLEKERGDDWLRCSKQEFERAESAERERDEARARSSLTARNTQTQKRPAPQ